MMEDYNKVDCTYSKVCVLITKPGNGVKRPKEIIINRHDDISDDDDTRDDIKVMIMVMMMLVIMMVLPTIYSIICGVGR